MNVTFYRTGFACNSSSQHSLVFLKKAPKNSEDHDFGWQNFTCSSEVAKRSYMFFCLYHSWRNLVDLHAEYDSHLDYKILHQFERAQFLNWVESELPYFGAEAKRSLDEEHGAYVDHQSVLAFPRYRRKAKLNIEFLKAFIPKVVECPNFVILGGNDNDEGSGHPLKGLDVASEGETIKLIFNAISDQESKEVMAEFDAKIGDFVLSVNRTGNIMRVQL